MSTVTVKIAEHTFAVGCEDGQETHVRALAAQFERQVQEVSSAVGRVGDLRLFLMAALMTADDLADTRARLARVQAELARLQADHNRSEARAAQALTEAAHRIEALAKRAG
jgi:cell division protein ZapA